MNDQDKRSYDQGYTKGYYDGHFRGRREIENLKSQNIIGYMLERLRQVNVQVDLIREELSQMEDMFK